MADKALSKLPSLQVYNTFTAIVTLKLKENFKIILAVLFQQPFVE
jgi:hypothetical protein